MLKNRLIIMLYTAGIVFSIGTKVMASIDTQRIWGNDRYDTAIEISKNGWKDSSEYVILANGENFPDALSAAPLAKKYSAPVLLNYGKSLDIRVENEIKRLNAKKVFIIGGKAVVPNSIENKLSEMGITVTRLYGQDRYETSVKVAEQLDFKGEIAIAAGENFPDAMSMAPVAAQKSIPILLTPMNKLPSSVANYIKDKTINKTYVIGGNDVVGDSIYNSLSNTERIYGDSRYDTNIAVLKKFEKELDFSQIYLANGENFPDALAGSVLAAKNSSAVILISDYAGQSTKDFVSSKINSTSKINILGGTAVISDKLINNITSKKEISNVDVNNIGNSNGNLYLGAKAAKQGEWIYFYDNNSGLYKNKEDGSSMSQLSNNCSGNINVVGDYIYYSGSAMYDESGPGIYKIKTDGSGKTKISDENPRSLIVVNNTIYYLTTSITNNHDNLYKMNTDGSGKTILNEEDSIESFNVLGNKIYYINHSDNNEMYKMNIDGSNVIKIRDEAVNEIVADDDWIYFSNDKGIYRIKDDNSKIECIVERPNSYNQFNISQGYIYYGGLYRAKVDGSEKREIINPDTIKLWAKGSMSVEVPNIAGEWMYYKATVFTLGEDMISELYKAKVDGSEIQPVFKH